MIGRKPTLDKTCTPPGVCVPITLITVSERSSSRSVLGPITITRTLPSSCRSFLSSLWSVSVRCESLASFLTGRQVALTVTGTCVRWDKTSSDGIGTEEGWSGTSLNMLLVSSTYFLCLTCFRIIICYSYTNVFPIFLIRGNWWPYTVTSVDDFYVWSEN